MAEPLSIDNSWIERESQRGQDAALGGGFQLSTRPNERRLRLTSRVLAASKGLEAGTQAKSPLAAFLGGAIAGMQAGEAAADIERQRQMSEQELLEKQMDNTPWGQVAPEMAKKSGIDPNLPLSTVKKFFPMMVDWQRLDAQREQAKTKTIKGRAVKLGLVSSSPLRNMLEDEQDYDSDLIRGLHEFYNKGEDGQLFVGPNTFAFMKDAGARSFMEDLARRNGGQLPYSFIATYTTPKEMTEAGLISALLKGGGAMGNLGAPNNVQSFADRHGLSGAAIATPEKTGTKPERKPVVFSPTPAFQAAPPGALNINVNSPQPPNLDIKLPNPYGYSQGK